MRVAYAHPVVVVEVHPDASGHEWVRLRLPDWVCVVPITASGEVVLVRQERFGTGLVHLEAPGGLVDRGETPEEAARRELLEETGYAADTLEPIGLVRPNPALQDNTCFLFVARQAVRVSEPRADPREPIDVAHHPLSAVGELVRSGAVDHAISVCALLRVLSGA